MVYRFTTGLQVIELIDTAERHNDCIKKGASDDQAVSNGRPHDKGVRRERSQRRISQERSRPGANKRLSEYRNHSYTGRPVTPIEVESATQSEWRFDFLGLTGCERSAKVLLRKQNTSGAEEAAEKGRDALKSMQESAGAKAQVLC